MNSHGEVMDLSKPIDYDLLLNINYSYNPLSALIRAILAKLKDHDTLLEDSDLNMLKYDNDQLRQQLELLKVQLDQKAEPVLQVGSTTPARRLTPVHIGVDTMSRPISSTNSATPNLRDGVKTTVDHPSSAHTSHGDRKHSDISQDHGQIKSPAAQNRKISISFPMATPGSSQTPVYIPQHPPTGDELDDIAAAQERLRTALRMLAQWLQHRQDVGLPLAPPVGGGYLPNGEGSTDMLGKRQKNVQLQSDVANRLLESLDGSSPHMDSPSTLRKKVEQSEQQLDLLVLRLEHPSNIAPDTTLSPALPTFVDPKDQAPPSPSASTTMSQAQSSQPTISRKLVSLQKKAEVIANNRHINLPPTYPSVAAAEQQKPETGKLSSSQRLDQFVQSLDDSVHRLDWLRGAAARIIEPNLLGAARSTQDTNMPHTTLAHYLGLDGETFESAKDAPESTLSNDPRFKALQLAQLEIQRQLAHLTHLLERASHVPAVAVVGNHHRPSISVSSPINIHNYHPAAGTTNTDPSIGNGMGNGVVGAGPGASIGNVAGSGNVTNPNGAGNVIGTGSSMPQGSTGNANATGNGTFVNPSTGNANAVGPGIGTGAMTGTGTGAPVGTSGKSGAPVGVGPGVSTQQGSVGGQNATNQNAVAPIGGQSSASVSGPYVGHASAAHHPHNLTERDVEKDALMRDHAELRTAVARLAAKLANMDNKSHQGQVSPLPTGPWYLDEFENYPSHDTTNATIGPSGAGARGVSPFDAPGLHFVVHGENDKPGVVDENGILRDLDKAVGPDKKLHHEIVDRLVNNPKAVNELPIENRNQPVTLVGTRKRGLSDTVVFTPSNRPIDRGNYVPGKGVVPESSDGDKEVDPKVAQLEGQLKQLWEAQKGIMGAMKVLHQQIAVLTAAPLSDKGTTPNVSSAAGNTGNTSDNANASTGKGKDSSPNTGTSKDGTKDGSKDGTKDGSKDGGKDGTKENALTYKPRRGGSLDGKGRVGKQETHDTQPPTDLQKDKLQQLQDEYDNKLRKVTEALNDRSPSNEALKAIEDLLNQLAIDVRGLKEALAGKADLDDVLKRLQQLEKMLDGKADRKDLRGLLEKPGIIAVPPKEKPGSGPSPRPSPNTTSYPQEIVVIHQTSPPANTDSSPHNNKSAGSDTTTANSTQPVVPPNDADIKLLKDLIKKQQEQIQALQKDNKTLSDGLDGVKGDVDHVDQIKANVDQVAKKAETSYVDKLIDELRKELLGALNDSSQMVLGDLDKGLSLLREMLDGKLDTIEFGKLQQDRLPLEPSADGLAGYRCLACNRNIDMRIRPVPSVWPSFRPPSPSKKANITWKQKHNTAMLLKEAADRKEEVEGQRTPRLPKLERDNPLPLE